MADSFLMEVIDSRHDLPENASCDAFGKLPLVFDESE